MLTVFVVDNTGPTEISTLSLHDALPISAAKAAPTSAEKDADFRKRQLESGKARDKEANAAQEAAQKKQNCARSEEHTSELQSLRHLVCRLLLEKKKTEE